MLVSIIFSRSATIPHILVPPVHEFRLVLRQATGWIQPMAKRPIVVAATAARRSPRSSGLPGSPDARTGLLVSEVTNCTETLSGPPKKKGTPEPRYVVIEPETDFDAGATCETYLYVATKGGAMNNNDVLDAVSEQLANLDARITRMADGETVAHTETVNAISDC